MATTPPAPAPPQPVLCDIQTIDGGNGIKICAMILQVPGAAISFTWAMDAATADQIGDTFKKAAATCRSGLVLPPGSGRITPPRA